MAAQKLSQPFEVSNHPIVRRDEFWWIAPDARTSTVAAEPVAVVLNVTLYKEFSACSSAAFVFVRVGIATFTLNPLAAGS